MPSEKFTNLYRLCLIGFVFLAFPCQTMAADSWQGKVVKVVDAATLDIAHQDGQVEQIKIGGISVPLGEQPGAEAATKRITSWCHQWGNVVTVIPKGRDDHGQTVARIIVGQEDLADLLTKACLAKVDIELCKKDWFPECVGWHVWELQCQDEKKGLWTITNQ